jgi:hypothetical protein
MRWRYSTFLSQTKEATLAEDIRMEVTPAEDTQVEGILAFTPMQDTLDIIPASTQDESENTTKKTFRSTKISLQKQISQNQLIRVKKIRYYFLDWPRV